MSEPVVIDLGFVPVWRAFDIPTGATRFIKLYTRRCLLGGWSFASTNSSALEPQLFDGGDANGLRVGVALLAGTVGFNAHTLPWPGVLCEAGIGVQVDSSSFGTVYIADAP